MKKPAFLFAIILIIVSCSHEPAVSTVAFTLSEKDLIPESIAFDPVTRQIFVSCIDRETILAVSEEGKEIDFALPVQDRLILTLGMKVATACLLTYFIVFEVMQLFPAPKSFASLLGF